MKIFGKNEPEPESPSEIETLRETVQNAHMPEAVEKAALKEVDRLAKNSPSSAEYTIGINYIDYLVSLPWRRMSEDHLDIGRAEAILDEEHYGLGEIKDRILEYLAVRILKLSRKRNILIVDDERTTRMNLEHVLRKEGYETRTAADGQEALELLETSPADLIITDLKMDRVDGMGLMERAKALDPNVEVIVITGYATVPTAIEAMKRGSHHFLAKPLRLNEVRSTVESALRRKQRQLKSRGPVLCFAGPPGTGKTSLGRAIARSLKREFVRFSLAGAKDEAEIRGHRRSYVGALPGRIIQEIRRVGYRNPVVMLDEIDKIGPDFKGDAAAALLEVLDPEQNSLFMDHYLDVPFDLSDVMFIATANAVDAIPGPLLDRLEVIHLSGYSEREKERIAFRYLIPREIEEAGLAETPPEFSTEAVRAIIRNHTREAGLRNLQRTIASVCRKKAREILDAGPGAKTASAIDEEAVARYLGPPKFHQEQAGARERVGVVTGLAWTETGGEIIFVEATRMKGTNRLILTGSLGEVMKESAQAALSYVRGHTERFGIPEDFFEGMDIHIHVPAGAIPKDGPSAGVTIAVALISLVTGRPCRSDAALTGELTLSGRILPVGGVREKLLAAHRAGIRTAVLPARNAADLRDIPEDVGQDLRVVPIEDLREALDWVLR
jgi:ATP-dependent Lon protease